MGAAAMNVVTKTRCSVVDPSDDQAQEDAQWRFHTRHPQDDDNDDDEIDVAFAAVTDSAVNGMQPVSPRRNNRRRCRHPQSPRRWTTTTTTAALLLLLAGGSTFVTLLQSSTVSTVPSSIKSLLNYYSHPLQPAQQDQQQQQQPTTPISHFLSATSLQQSLTTAIQSIPLLGARQQHVNPPKEEDARFRNRVLLGIPPVVLFTAESAELAWENYLESAILHPLRQHNSLRSKSESLVTHATTNRRTKKKGWNDRTLEVGDVGGDEPQERTSISSYYYYNNSYSEWISRQMNSPLSASLFAVCGILFLTATLVVGSRLRSRATSNVDNFFHGAVTEKSVKIALDEDEAEIIEFYEKELPLQTIPFLQNQEVEAEDDNVCKPINGMTNGIAEEDEVSIHRYLLIESPVDPPFPSLPPHHHRSLSDSSLTRHNHHHHRGPEKRQSQGDPYYSMVLTTLNYDEVIGGNNEDNELRRESSEKGRIDYVYEYERPLVITPNVSTLTEDEVCCAAPADPTFDDDDDLQSFKSTQSEEIIREEELSREQDKDYREHDDLSQGPPSSHSSMSSLTSDGSYDIEAACGKRRIHEDDMKLQSESHRNDAVLSNRCTSHSTSRSASATSVSPRLRDVSKRLALTAAVDCDQDFSPAGAPTPPRSNRHRDRDRHHHHDYLLEERNVTRRVSFCNQVKVRKIPLTQTAKQPCHECSSETYLYVMLFTVAIVIGIFSLLPVNPSLSPIYSMDRISIFQRADTILSSQWDVEL